MRSFLFGLALIITVTVTVLSVRPGGLRRQFRFAARRFRIALMLGGLYIVLSSAIRIVFPTGFVADYGPPLLAAVLIVFFLFAARDPRPAPESSPPSLGR